MVIRISLVNLGLCVICGKYTMDVNIILVKIP